MLCAVIASTVASLAGTAPTVIARSTVASLSAGSAPKQSSAMTGLLRYTRRDSLHSHCEAHCRFAQCRLCDESSLRGALRRSNPLQPLDCFVTLAVTECDLTASLHSQRQRLPVIARSTATKQSIAPFCILLVKMHIIQFII